MAFIAVFLYTTGAWSLWRSVRSARLSALAWVCVVFAILDHSIALVHSLRTYGLYSIGLSLAVSLLGWTLAILGCLVALERRNRALAAVLVASAAVGAAFTGGTPTFVESAPPSWELTAHILMSMAAAALFFAAAVTGILIVILDRRLRARRVFDLPAVLPPLDSLETIMFRLIGCGEILLTLALLTGFIFVTNLFAQHLVHKTVLSVIAWLLFAVLLAGRIRFGWRGRPAVRWTLIGFALLVLAYFGSKFVLESLLGRHWG